jgi:hypothetical protein
VIVILKSLIQKKLNFNKIKKIIPKNLKYFLTSLGVTSLFILLVMGFATAEKNIRKSVCNDDRPLLEYNFKDQKTFIQLTFMGTEFKANF